MTELRWPFTSVAEVTKAVPAGISIGGLGSARDGRIRFMASDQLPEARIERNIDNIERQVKEMRHSLKLLVSNPRKYAPQLENLADAALNAAKSAEIIVRAIARPED